MASPLFWDDEKELLYEIMYPQILDAVEAGLLDAADMLGSEIGLDWSLLNAWAVDYAKTYTYELVSDITAESMAVLQGKINAWMQTGAPLDDLISSLTAGDLYSDYRAFMIATTEVTRAFGEGNLELWKQSGVVKQVTWMTAQDEIVCDICGALDGQVINLGEEGFQGYAHGDDNGLVDCPPAHVNCRCWIQPVWG